jgi:hypothetical protein
MIRIGTILWAGLALLAGYSVIQFKYEVQALERELRRVNADILRHQEAIHVLRAEWAYLNEPKRLEALSRRHLDLFPVRGSQMADLAELPTRETGIAGPVLPTPNAPNGGGRTVPQRKPEPPATLASTSGKPSTSVKP